MGATNQVVLSTQLSRGNWLIQSKCFHSFTLEGDVSL